MLYLCSFIWERTKKSSTTRKDYKHCLETEKTTGIQILNAIFNVTISDLKGMTMSK